MADNLARIQRDILHNKLSGIDGVAKAYFQPPDRQSLEYPCIIYQFNDFSNTEHADNDRYIRWPEYTVTIIDSDPESAIPERLERLKYQGCYVQFNRFFIADNLNHWLFDVVLHTTVE